MSSDSEDDCYGNVAQKLQSIKNTYEPEQTKTSEILYIDSTRTESSSNLDKPIILEDCLSHESDEDICLDTLIAQNSKRRRTRNSKQAGISEDNILPRRGKRKRSATESTSNGNEFNNETLTIESPSPRTSRGKRRGRISNNTSNVSTASNSNTESNEPPERGRNRGHRGRGRGRSRKRAMSRRWFYDDLLAEDMCETQPIYNVGNTYDYPDVSEGQPLFTNKPNEALTIELNEPANDSIDENEELSVKVYWRNSEYHKFNIRRFQKLVQVFNFFAERENVSQDKLLFTYNEKILKIDDTPDSITYSIAKFIDGGIINQSISKIVRKDVNNTQKSGLKIKFQCQNVKKPFEMVVQLEDKLGTAMMMCAEHFEKPLDKMKFFFDGDLVLGKNTPNDLDLEGGECIDVKILS